ncbi:MAG: hypothetical protein ACOZQL_36630 [Myxococcota bacterium]
MRSINQYFEELGRRKGLRAGLKREREAREALRKELRGAVEKVLTRRFKKLPPSVEEKLEKADVATLKVWFDAALEARSLRDVFP